MTLDTEDVVHLLDSCEEINQEKIAELLCIVEPDIELLEIKLQQLNNVRDSLIRHCKHLDKVHVKNETEDYYICKICGLEE